MAIKDTLLALTSFPDPTPDHAIAEAVGIAQRLGAKIAGVAFVLNRSRIPHLHPFGEWLVNSESIVDGAIRKSEDAAAGLLNRFENKARAAGVFASAVGDGAPVFPIPSQVTERARTRDLTFLPVPEQIGMDEIYTEAVVFESGRPVVLLPARAGYAPMASAGDTVVVAWDYSRAAARSLSDALPILEQARRVIVLTVTNEKELKAESGTADLERHLKTHGINAGFKQVDAKGRPIGAVLTDFVAAEKADMLVMGAFGHARLVEFVLGGATRSILSRPPVPVFLSY